MDTLSARLAQLQEQRDSLPGLNSQEEAQYEQLVRMVNARNRGLSREQIEADFKSHTRDSGCGG
jgi:hypothetical protein